MSANCGTIPNCNVVHIIGRDGERIFDERDVQFIVGEGELSFLSVSVLTMQSVMYHCFTS